ncbi:MAG TPA: polysaccharide deacetylase family protein [Sedimentisphaerales bacterium]|nr:polysaccharide deacetylase family protein [Sedimentisphaerales bacterium]
MGADSSKMDNSPSRSAVGTRHAPARIAEEDTCLILQYHRVATLCHDPFQIAVQPHKFESQIRYLAENFNVISMDEIRRHLENAEPFTERTVAITFDGGYADLLYTAKDVLERFRVFATVFTPSAQIIEPQLFWQNELEDILIAGNPRGHLEIEIDDRCYMWSLTNRRDAFRTFDVLCSIMPNRTPSVQRRIVGQIRRALDSKAAEPDCHRTMDARELRMLRHGGLITIGGHTHNLTKLSALPQWQQIEELARNKDVLEEALGRRIEYFSYPFGCEDSHTTKTMAALENLGFTLACANSYGTVAATDSATRYELPRVKVGNWNPFTFYKFLEGFFS